MKPNKIIIALACLGIATSVAIKSLQAQSNINLVRYQKLERSHYTVHTVFVPQGSRYKVSPAMSGDLQPITAFTGDKVVAAVNGGYFDPVNQKTTSFMVQDSQLLADPRFNERLVDNPDLKPYLRKIFNRAEFRRYSCNEATQYDIQPHFAPIPSDCTIIESLGGGPGLLPKDSSVAEGFIAYRDGEKIRDAIGNNSSNARSAIGITAEGDVILMMVAQQAKQPLNSGISLPKLAKEMSDLGAVKAMNLDGGSSASLYYQGEEIYGRVDKEGNKIIRPIKSVLQVIEE